MSSLNRSIFDAINHWPEWMAPTMRFFSEATNWLWVKLALALLLLALFLGKGKTRLVAVQALLAFPLANGMTDVLKHTFPMHRPFQELSDVIVRVGRSDSMGTASAHSANMAAVAFVFVYHLRGWGSPWILVAVLTGLSRMYNGVHWPYQVLLGWICGCLAGLLVTQVGKLILRKRAAVSTVENPSKE